MYLSCILMEWSDGNSVETRQWKPRLMLFWLEFGLWHDRKLKNNFPPHIPEWHSDGVWRKQRSAETYSCTASRSFQAPALPSEDCRVSSWGNQRTSLTEPEGFTKKLTGQTIYCFRSVWHFQKEDLQAKTGPSTSLIWRLPLITKEKKFTSDWNNESQIF